MDYLFLGIVALFGVAFTLLWVANLPDSQRHKQIWSPLLALVIAAAFIAGTHVLPASSTAPWRQTLTQIFQRGTGLPAPPLPLLVLILHGLGILAFSVVKLLINGGVRLLSRFTSSSLSGISQYVYQEADDDVVLRPGWYFPGLLARSTALIALAVLLLCILARTVVDPLALATSALSVPPPGYPLLPALPAFVLFEVGWYLNGLRAPNLSEEHSPDIDPVDPKIKGTYDDLWDEYQEIWPEKVLAASRHPIERLPGSSPRGTVSDEQDPELQTVWRDLLRHPEVQFLDEDDYEVLSRLWNGEDLLVEDPTYDRIAPVLATVLYYDLLDGGRTLILIDPRRSAELQSNPTTASIRWITQWIQKLHGAGDNLQVHSLDAFRRRSSGDVPDILVASAEELSSLNILGRGRREDIKWFLRVEKVVILDGSETLFRHTQSTSALLHTLDHLLGSQREDGRSPQLVVLSENRRNLQPSLQQILPAEPFEKRLPFPRPHNPYVICWRTKGAPFQNAMFRYAGYRIGDEPVLALPAWREDLSSISIAEQQDLPYREFLEELDRHKTQLQNSPVSVATLRGQTSERLVCHQDVPWLIPQQDRTVTIVRDQRCNLIRTVQRWLSAGRKHAFLHVVSSPYLLRDYFASNVDFFLSVDAPVGLQSPQFSKKTIPFVAHQLLRRLMSEWIDEQTLHRILESIGRDEPPVENALQDLFNTAFGVDVLGDSLLEWKQEYEYQPSIDRFVPTTLFHLRRRRLLSKSSLDWMASISVVDDTGRVLDTLPREHLFQRFLPGQVHAFNGRPYRVQEADLENQELKVAHDEQWDGRVGYRPDLNVILEGADGGISHRQAETENGWNVVHDLRPFEARVETNGYFRLDAQEGSLVPSHQNCSSAVPTRTYEHAWVAHLSFRPPANNTSAVSDDELSSISWTLSVLLREALPTIFPETTPLLLVLPPSDGRSPLPHVLPHVRYGVDLSSSPAVDLYIFEDSRSDLGLAKRILNQWKDVFGLLDDYVHWITTQEKKPNTRARERWNIQVDSPEGFWAHGPRNLSNDAELLDLEATKDFLDALFEDDESCLRSRRQDYYRGRRTIRGREDGQQCDFCRQSVSDIEYEQLDDGRVRCSDCSKLATDTNEELQEAYRDARFFLEDTLGREIAHDVDVTLTDTRAVQQAAGKEFVPTSSFDPRTLGIAIRDQGDLSILVENGQPYYMAKGVIVHELTHIWQFEELNYRQMRSEEGNVIVEGHAKWAELKSIQDLPEAESYIERQKTRNDEYGVGYRRICEILDDHSDVDTPFELLLRRYGHG